jgi:3-methyladenine DNA glycosylase/8-oxoguanine DNA glycosylase
LTPPLGPRAAAPLIECGTEVRPRWPFRLPARAGFDGLTRVRDGTLERLVHVEDEPVAVTVRQPAAERVLFVATAPTRAAGEEGIARMRFALGVDDDLRPFHERFRWDPLLGRALRANPRLRVRRRPDPFEALAWAICEQLIEVQRAVAILRRIVRRLGRSCPRTGLLDAPAAERLATVAPAYLQSLDLSAGRAVALRRAAGEVAAGRIDLGDADHERGWGRLRAIPGIGRWTVEMLALHGQGRLDQLPAGDLGYLKLVGRLRTGNPRARAREEDVRELLAPYEPWSGLAGAYLLSAAARGGAAGLQARATRPGPAGTRSSAPRRRSAAA